MTDVPPDPEGPRQDRPRRLPVLPGDRDEVHRFPEGSNDREPKQCRRCGNWCLYDGWGHVHAWGIGIESCNGQVRPLDEGPPDDDDDGTSGQDRKSYIDDQDRESYVVAPQRDPEGPDDEALAVACPKCKASPGEPCVTGGYLPVGDLPGDETAYGPHRQRRRAALSATVPAPPEGPDEELRERRRLRNTVEHRVREVYRDVTADSGMTAHTADAFAEEAAESVMAAVLPLLTAERERVDALQRQVNQVRALCDKAKQQQPGRLPAVDVRDLDAALSRTATEETQ